ncbi:MAG: acylneuraminate cytidylyltransferase family protein [Acidobacteria bacterium]|nr:acylneuraminate cytidylyltransferase family protein [Acidobacteriota bacterium]
MTPVTVVIPARAGSKRVPGKNVRSLAGQPLVLWSVRAALAARTVTDIVVSTDDPAIVELTQHLPVRTLLRPPHLATDTASTDDVLKHVLSEGSGEGPGTDRLVVLLQPTSPLREVGLIDEGVRLMHAHSEAARLLEVTRQALGTGRRDGVWWLPDFPEDMRSQEIPPLWYPTGRLYVYRPRLWFGDGREERALALEADLERCTNIDHEVDFHWAQHVFERFEQEYRYLCEPCRD